MRNTQTFNVVWSGTCPWSFRRLRLQPPGAGSRFGVACVNDPCGVSRSAFVRFRNDTRPASRDEKHEHGVTMRAATDPRKTFASFLTTPTGRNISAQGNARGNARQRPGNKEPTRFVDSPERAPQATSPSKQSPAVGPGTSHTDPPIAGFPSRSDQRARSIWLGSMAANARCDASPVRKRLFRRRGLFSALLILGAYRKNGADGAELSRDTGKTTCASVISGGDRTEKNSYYRTEP